MPLAPATATVPPATPTATPMEAAPAHAPPREIAPFLKSLRAMLDEESDAVLRWTPDGRAFEIRDVQALTKTVLPKYFKHAKYASFQRQLNYFHFRKWTKSRTEVCTFANPHFQRDEPHLSWRILRKRSLCDVTATAASSSSSTSAKAATGTATATASATATGSASDDSASLGGESPRSELDVALDWIDAVFPSLEMLCALGREENQVAKKKTRRAAAPSKRADRHRRDAPMPAQSYEHVAW